MKSEMKPIRETIPLEEARQLIANACRPIDRTERVRLVDANGRAAAVDVHSTRDVPPFSRAGMDGFAVRAEDTFGASRYEPKTLRVIDKVYTGEIPKKSVEAGTAIEIATGAPMPHGADAVVMVEETERVEGSLATEALAKVAVLTPVYPRQNVGKQGADIVVGQTVIARGDVLNPSRIGALAALGVGDVEVYVRPTVAILSTGNEIADPGQELLPGQIYDINKYTLSTIIQEHGGVPMPFSTAQDTIDALEEAIDGALGRRSLGEGGSCDMLVFSGGSSVGERDLILDVIGRKGDIVFHGIAVKPGKPTVFGTIEGKPMFGMPGYPTSCLSNAYMLLVPALRAMARLHPRHTATVSLPLGQRIVSTTGRHQFYTVKIVDGQAMPAFKASGDITSMSQADGYIEIAAQTDIVEKGERVNVKLF
ncbi:MAG TPA: gephyrin-like molybdotransferase Glp [Vicinamibacterales bacterium]|nr:gephyrin-like molybdotransferase Glp [Vicinamibacterales bacterium]